MNNRRLGQYIFLHVVLIIYSLGALFSKMASKSDFMSLKFIIYYGLVLFVLFIYAILWQQLLKKFDLTIIFANKGMVIAWGMIWGKVFFKEQLKWNMFIGAILIILGILLVVSEDKK